MSEIKPVYQSQTGGEWHDVTDKEYAFRKELSGVYKTRILYPAAAYEALQKENAELRDRITIMDEAAKYYNETIIGISNKLHAQNEALKLKKEFIEYAAQDLENQNEALKAENEAQAKRIEAIETLCTHDYESKDDFILRVKEILKNGDSK